MIVDILIVVAVIVMTLIGKKRGLVRSLVSMAGFLISIILAATLCKPIGDFLIKNTDWDENIKTVISSTIKIDDVKLDSNNKYPEVINKYISGAVDGVNETKDNIKDNITTGITTQVMYGIAYIFIFILTKGIVIVLRIISKIVEKLPLIDKMNELGGALLGFAKGVIVVYVVLTLVSVLSPLMQDTMIIDQVNNSYIGSFLYNNNIVMLQFKA